MNQWNLFSKNFEKEYNGIIIVLIMWIILRIIVEFKKELNNEREL